VQQLPKVPEGRTGNRIPVTGMHKTAALERRKTIASWESKERGTVLNLTASGSGSGGDGRPRDTLIIKAVMHRGRCARCNVDHDA
jgi:hypothetical protein